MKKLLFLIILVFSYYQINAQTPGVAPLGSARITGIVMDSGTNTPVPYATVALIDPNTKKPVNGDICDDKGKFTLSKIEAGVYNISISFIGYKPVEITSVEVPDRGEVNLGTINIAAEVTELAEIKVEAQRELIEEKVDRTVYNAELDATTRGGDATDVLKRVPMLSVDLDGNVSLRGSQNIRVLINNKPSTITAGSVADALKQIPADEIKSVEVITSPSAKYDAEGTGGIINIITKKNNLQGLTMDIRGGVGLRGSDLHLGGNYRKKKFGISLGGFMRSNYNAPGSFQNSQLTKNADDDQLLNTQSADTRRQGLFGRYSLNWDYDINKKNYLSGSIQYGARNQNVYQDGLLTQTFQNDVLTNISNRNVNTKDLSGTTDISVTYGHTFKKPQQELSLMALYSLNNRTNDFTNSILDNNDFSVTSRLLNNNKSNNREMTFQADYTSPIGNTQIIEFGAKQILREVTSNYQLFQAEGANGPYVPNQNSTLSNVFNYDQNVSAAYMSYTVNIAKKYGIKVGSRYEYTTINAKFQDGTEVTIPSYGVIVPSINLSKKFKAGNMLKLAYNRRISRPSIQFLNPNIQASNPLNISYGNPSLDPEFTNNFELGYSTYMKSVSLNFSTFYNNTNNAIQSVRDVVGQDTIRTTYQNIGLENAYGISIFTNINMGKKLTLSGGGDVYYADLKNNVPNPLYNASNQGWVYSYRLFGGYNFTEKWGLQFFSFYRGRQVQLQGFQGNFFIYSLALKRDIANKRGSIGFGAENFLGKGINIRNQLNSPIIDQSGNSFNKNLSFKITFNYRIGKMSMDGPQRRRKSINNDDLKEGGNGGENNSEGGNQPQQGRPTKTQPTKNNKDNSKTKEQKN